MSKTQYWLKKDGKNVEVQAGEFWRAFFSGFLSLLVNLPRYILREVVWHFDIALRKACNALGRRIREYENRGQTTVSADFHSRNSGLSPITLLHTREAR